MPMAEARDASASTTRVSACVCTYRRASLARTLASLGAQHLPPGVSLEVVVIDNDATGSAAAIAAAGTGAERHLPVHYVIEPRKGIPFARNRALDVAGGEWLAWIDDDEAADPSWLSALLAAAGRHGAAAVVGTVEPMFEVEVPAWVRDGGFFRKPCPPEGTRLPTAATCNVLVRAELVRRHGLRFDPAFAATGGEDTVFFRQLEALGGAIVAAPAAIVWETIPSERSTARYLVRKSLRVGETFARISYGPAGTAARLGAAVDAVLKTIASGALALATAPLGRARSLGYGFAMLRNIGKLRYLLGASPVELYK